MRLLYFLSRVPLGSSPSHSPCEGEEPPRGNWLRIATGGRVKRPATIVFIVYHQPENKNRTDLGSSRWGGNSVGPSETSRVVLVQRARSQSFESDIASEAKVATLRRGKFWKAGKGYRAQPDSSSVFLGGE